MHQESDSKPAAGGVNPWRRASGVVAFALLGALTGCDKNSTENKPAETAQPAQAPAAQPPAPKPTMVTVLVTGSANGQLLPRRHRGREAPPSVPPSCSAGGRPRRSTAPAR